MNTQTNDPYHYNVIARAIKEIDGAGGTALSLDDLAGRMNMSPAHFQRIFSKWAGVSPKRYQQYLVLDHARTLLENHATLAETALAVGMSGTGRLHDLFVRWEAMSPGEFARKGKSLIINWGWFDSPFGDLLAAGTDRGICGLAFAAELGRQFTFDDLTGRWPAADFRESPEEIEAWVRSALSQRGDASLFLVGTPFQIKVWEALLAIPSGHVTTYMDLAKAAGSPRAIRAVGNAVGRNPVSWLIPCHRALRKSGNLGGYHWGLPVKRSLLAWEAARRDAGSESR